MRIVFFTHPSFLGSQSMPRFANMLTNGMQQRGHETEVWTPEAFLYNLGVPKSLKKWLGYIDQYILFPGQVRKRLKAYPAETLFVFTDHALGPWIPLVAKRPHVIHCHDFLAQQSALGMIAENKTGNSGKKYQRYIRSGYSKGKNFISVSVKTQTDLHQMLGSKPAVSEVVYNGLNQDFTSSEVSLVRMQLSKETNIDLSGGYILHIGGNQWYKNRVGVIQIYNAWRAKNDSKLPLMMLGVTPNPKIMAEYDQSPYKNDIHLLSGKSDLFVRNAYAGASVLLFPSLAEGFGWPIAEAMASGCPVITTGEAPMTEVGGDAAFYIPRQPQNAADLNEWLQTASNLLNTVLTSSAQQRTEIISKGFINVGRFDTDVTLNEIEKIYQQIVAS
ncbi:glycosyltransferase [Mucilaginibacter kameinonensis]|uniref:glycosyltransferase n=1 Tax=Mucilaginibacter kameinonensis TaxID=452286 RepID=UPI000EF766C8|nr:glycosyltransferase [Mucilaginibacter kameinonensis]